MEILTINLPANGTAAFRKAGSYVEILSAIGPIGITMNSVSGGQINSINGGVSGLFLNANFGAFTVQDQSGAAQQVLLLTCDPGEVGGSRRQPGIVSVTNQISAKITQLEMFGATLTPIGIQAVAFILPAANVSGALIRRAQCSATAAAGGTSEVRIVAAPTVPVLTVPSNAYQMSATAGNAGVAVSDVHVDQNYRLPPGWGVWAVTNHLVNPAASCGAALSWELL